MKLQFSLATLLICMTVLAVVCAFAVALPVYQSFYFADGDDPSVIEFPDGSGLQFDQPVGTVEKVYQRHATASEITWRIAIFGASIIAATLAALWLIRALKSHRHNEPPVG